MYVIIFAGSKAIHCFPCAHPYLPRAAFILKVLHKKIRKNNFLLNLFQQPLFAVYRQLDQLFEMRLHRTSANPWKLFFLPIISEIHPERLPECAALRAVN